MRALLESPEPDSPLNIDAGKSINGSITYVLANLLRGGDQEGYDCLVRLYTHMHAKSRGNFP